MRITPVASAILATLTAINCRPAWGAAAGSVTALPNGPVLDIGAYASAGSMNNGDSTIPTRNMDSLAAIAELGWRWRHFVPFFEIEYGYSSQTTPPSSVNNQNLSGSGFLMAGGLRYDWSKIFVTLGYDFSGNYQLDKKTTDGLTSVYSDPTGYLVMVGYHFNSKTSGFLIYRQTNYATSTLGGKDTDISSNKLSQTVYGLAIAYSFF